MLFKKKKERIMPEFLEDFPGTHNDSELFQIFKKHEDRIIHKWIHYFEIYENHFAKFRGKEINILEIGVFKGGSLQMWKEYFGPKAKIYGVDIDPNCKKFEEENIEIFIGDQNDREFLRGLTKKLPKFDIVIDDGGHTSKQQITTFEEIYAHTAENGVYLVEDTHTNYWRGFNKGVKQNFIDYAKKFADSVHEWHFEKWNFNRFALPFSKREGELQVSEFTKTTQSVTFYDSVVVFQKKKMVEPYHCLRGKKED